MTEYTVTKVDKIDGRWVATAHGPKSDLSSMRVGETTVYANDGVMLTVMDVWPIEGQPDSMTLRAGKLASELGIAASPKRWTTLRGGEGAQWPGGVRPPENPLYSWADPGSIWAAIPGWVKWGAAGAGALYVASYLLPGDES